MELNKGHIAFAVACFVAGCIVGGSLRGCTAKPDGELVPPTVVHDTVIITDTLRIKGKTKTLEVHDTVWLVKPDSNGIDTIKPLVNETKLYRDTFTTDSSFIALGVKYTGYEATIDNIDLQYRFSVQPRTIVKKKGWGQFIGVGIGVGYGASFVGHPSGVGTIVHAAPEIGVHITYGWGYHW